MHRLLHRQLRKHLSVEDEVPAPLTAFIAAVDAAYADFDSEHKLLERSLELSSKELVAKEAQLHLALDNMPGGMTLEDRDRNYVFFNSQYSELHDYPEGFLKVGMSARDELCYQAERGDFGPGNRDELVEQALAVYQSGKAASWERTFPDGRTLRFNVAPTPEGGFVTIATDITDMVESQRGAKLLQEALDNFSDMVILYDKDERVVFTNVRYHEIYPNSPPKDEITNFTLEGLLRRSLEAGQIAHPLAKSNPEAWLQEALANRRSIGGGGETTHESGHTYMFQHRRTTEGGMILTQTDISARKRAEQELAEKEAQLRVALDNMPGGMLLLDRNLNYVLFNSQYSELFEYPDGLVRVGGSLRDALRYRADRGDFGPGNKDELIEPVVTTYQRGEAESFEREIAGSGRTLQIYVAPTPEGGYVTIATDISARKQVEVNLQAAKDEAERANHAKSQFLANMSHELRTPLNAILGYIELIQDSIYGDVSEKVREVIGRIDHNGRHLLNQINDVLDLSKIEAGELKLSLNDYAMQDIVDGVISNVGSLAAEKNLTLNAIVPSDLPTGRGDDRRISQVLLNLVGNAIKFTDRGEVSVRVSASDGEFQVAVADTGIDISEADRAEILNEFYQADSSSTRAHGGTGLGLAIVKRMVELHGGRLSIESALGEGSTFSFSLPVRVAQNGVKPGEPT